MFFLVFGYTGTADRFQEIYIYTPSGTYRHFLPFQFLFFLQIIINFFADFMSKKELFNKIYVFSCFLDVGQLPIYKTIYI